MALRKIFQLLARENQRRLGDNQDSGCQILGLRQRLKVSGTRKTQQYLTHNHPTALCAIRENAFRGIF